MPEDAQAVKAAAAKALNPPIKVIGRPVDPMRRRPVPRLVKQGCALDGVREGRAKFVISGLCARKTLRIMRDRCDGKRFGVAIE